MIEQTAIQLGIGGFGLLLMYKLAKFALTKKDDNTEKIAGHISTISANLNEVSNNLRELRANTDRMECVYPHRATKKEGIST